MTAAPLPHQQHLVSQRDLTFLVSPSEVVFKDFVPFQRYEQALQFKNQTTTVKYVRVLAPDSRFFTISEPKSTSSTLKVAAGLSVTYTVIFKPEEDTDYDCDIVCVTESERFVVSVKALSSKGKMDMPSSVTIAGPVKVSSSQVMSVRNIGTKAVQWQLDSPTPFNINPRIGFLDVGGAMQLSVNFTPPFAKSYVGDAKVSFSTGDTQMIRLTGQGHEVDVHLSTNMVELQRTFISLERQAYVKLVNRGDVRLNFCWKAHDTEEEELAAKSALCDTLKGSQDKAMRSRRGSVSELKGITRHFRSRQAELEGGNVIFENGVFTIEPVSGSIAAKAECEFIVTFNPQMATVYHCTAYLDVQGRVGRLPMSMKGHGLGPQCAFSFDALDLTDIFINSIHQYEVTLENRGSIEARFALRHQQTYFGSKFKFSPNSGTIPPGGSQLINITFCSDIIGIINEVFNFIIQGAKDELSLHFKGRVIGPTFHFDVEELDFGNVSYNFWHIKTFNLVNTSDISMRYTLRIPEDGVLGKKEFDIVPATGHILPKGKAKIQVDFLSNTVQEYNAHLMVDIAEVGENLESLPIKATCIVPDVTISRNLLDYGTQCFINHPYPLDLEIKNETPLSAKFEVIVPSDEDVSRKKAEITVGSGDPKERKGIVHARSVQKVAIVLTGRAVCAVHMTIYIRILGSDKPPFPISVTGKITGPVVSIPMKVLDFGSTPVLDERTEYLTMHNNSPIPASFTCKLLGKTPSGLQAPYSLKVDHGVIEKNSSFQLPVNVHLDETMKFVEELVISIQNSSEETIKLTSTGKGTTLVPSIPLTKDIEFGDIFTTSTEKRTLVLANHGRKPLQLQWYYDRSKPKEGEPPLIFTITPERATINQKSEETFVIEARNDVAGTFTESFQCKLSKTHKIVFHPKLVAHFHTPLLTFSATKMEFEYAFDKDRADPLRQNRIITMKNISPLPLEFTIKVLKATGAGDATTPPFAIDKADHLLREGDSATIGIAFDANYRGDRVSHKVSTKLQIQYKDHPQRDHITLVADVQFPNLIMEGTAVDFGCALNDTEVKRTFTITNDSKVPAYFVWCFEDEPTRPESTGTTMTARTTKGLATAPLNVHNVFDILPHRGYIKAGETETIDFIFYGHAGRKVRTTAVCQVEGGPDYNVNLAGEASTIQFKFDRNLLDFGAQQYDKWEEKEIFLSNTGKVGFPFTVDLSNVKGGTVEVSPMQGTVKDKVRLLVKFSPRVPDRVQEYFSVQVGHFEPQVIAVKGLGLYTSIMVVTADKFAVTRAEKPSFPSQVKEARQQLQHVDPVPYPMLAAQTLKGARAGGLGATMAIPSETTTTISEQDVICEAERMDFRDMITMDVTKSSAQVADNAMDVKRRGPGGEFKYVLSRYVIDFGTVVRGEQKRRSFRIVNTSLVPILLGLDKRVFVNSGVTFSIEKLPKLTPQENVTIDVTLSTKQKNFPLDKFNLDIPIDIKNGPLVIVEVRAFVIVPAVQVSSDNLDFGTVQVGQCRVMTVQFHNKQSLACEWTATFDDGKRRPDKKVRNQFHCSPSHGILASGERIAVEVGFTPSVADSLQHKLVVKVSHNPRPLEIACRGLAEDLQVALAPENVSLDPVFPFKIGQCSFQLINKSNCAVEVYSLQMDNTYLIEEEILKNCDKFFGEADVLLLPPRQTGASLPDELMEHYYNYLMEEEGRLSNVDIVPERGATGSPADATAPIPVVSPRGSERMSISHAKTAVRTVVVFWGPPKSGSSAFAEVAAKAQGVPIITMDDIAQYAAEYDSLEGAHIRNIIESPEVELNATYVQSLLTKRMSEPDAELGFVFDGLSGKLLFNDDLLLRALKESCAKLGFNLILTVLDIDEQLISLRTKLMEVDEATQKMTESHILPVSEDVYDSMTDAERANHDRRLKQYRLDKKRVEVLNKELAALKAERTALSEQDRIFGIAGQIMKEAEELAAREAEENASKKKAPAKKRGSVADGAPPLVALNDLSKLERFRKFYPSIRRALTDVPSEAAKFEQVDCVRPFEECVATISQALPNQGRTSRLESSAEVVQESCDLVLPPPVTMQRIDRPLDRRPIVPAPNFTLLTPETPPEPVQTGKPESRKGGKGQAQAQPEEVRYTKESRWIIPKGGTQDLVLQYKSSETTSLEGILQSLSFGVVSSSQVLDLSCKATCSYPDITRDPKHVFAKKIRTRDDKFVFKSYVTNRKTYEFGPLLIVKDRKPADAPPANTDKLKVTNSGLFPAEVSIMFEQAQDKEKTFHVSPETLKLAPGESQEVTLIAVPERVGEIRNALVMLVKDNPEPVRFEVSCIGSKPDVTVNDAKECTLDFGRLLIRRNDEKVIRIKNVSYLPIHWRITGAEKLPTEYKIEKMSDVIEPKVEQSIKVGFLAERANIFNFPLKLEVSDSDGKVATESLPLQLKCEAFDVVLEWTKDIDFKTVRVGEEKKETLKLLNKGLYEVQYQLRTPKKYADVFTITPVEGILKPQSGAKDANITNVEVLFRSQKEMQVGKKGAEFEVAFIEPTINDLVYPAQPIHIKAESYYNKYQIKPSQINFGPCLYKQKKQATFDIVNQGCFELKYRLFSYKDGFKKDELPPETSVPKKAAGKKNAAAADIGGDITLGAFTVSPAISTIPIGGIQTVTVSLNPEGSQNFHEMIGIHIEDRDPTDHPDGIPFELEAESCVPGIIADLESAEAESVFEEQQIISRFDPFKKLSGVFAREDKVFSFGVVISNKRVSERFRLTNPNKVPCTVQVAIQPRGDAPDSKTAAEAFDIQGQKFDGGKLTIPPYEHRYVTVGFTPIGLNTFNAVFVATVENGFDPKSKQLRFEIRGEGSLPDVSLELPPPPITKPVEAPVDPKAKGKSAPAADKKKGAKVDEEVFPPNSLVFPRTIVGTKVARPLTVKNTGDLPATIRFTLPTGGHKLPFAFPSKNEEILIPPQGREKFMMFFEPSDVGDYKAKLIMSVQDNHYEDVTVQVMGEASIEDLIFDKIDESSHNMLTLGDCMISATKTKKFFLRSFSSETLRFQWAPGQSDKFTFTPALGHIPPKASKEIVMTYLSAEPEVHERTPFSMQVSKIALGEVGTSDWDDRATTVKWEQSADSKLLKKVVEPQTEPEHTLVEGDNSAFKKELQVSCICDYAHCEVSHAGAGVAAQLLSQGITFARTKLFQKRTFQFSLRNVGKVSAEFKWDFLDAQGYPVDPSTSNFKAEPASETILAGQQTLITVSYVPLDVGNHEAYLVASIPNVAPTSTEIRIPLIGDSECPLVHFDLPDCDYLSRGRRDAELPGPRGHTQRDLPAETQVVEFVSRGVKVTNSKRFVVVNPSNFSYEFEWTDETADPATSKLFSCMTQKGVIHSGKQYEMHFQYTPENLNLKEAFFRFTVQGKLSVLFCIVGRAVEPDVYFNRTKISFDKIQIGAKSKQVIYLENHENISFPFQFDKVISDTTSGQILNLTPTNGTVPPNSQQPIEITFSPQGEEPFNYNLYCRVKKKTTPITCNVKGEGFTIHERIILKNSDGSSFSLQPHVPNVIDLGRVYIKESAKRQFMISNDGRYHIDYKFVRGECPFLTLSNELGTVHAGQNEVVDLTYTPTKDSVLTSYKVALKITNGNTYTLHLNANAVQPNVTFSWKNFDFGPCFVYSPGAVPSVATLVISNSDLMDVSLECDYENKEYLEVDIAPLVIKGKKDGQPDDKREVQFRFMPREAVVYKDMIKFTINGLYIVNINVTGEGTLPRVDIQGLPAKALNFGAVRVGDRKTMQAKLVCYSKIPTPVSLEGTLTPEVQKNQISLYPTTAFVMRPKETRVIDVTFAPSLRMRPFQSELLMDVVGQRMPLFGIAGACHGVEVHLDVKFVQFGQVVVGTRVTRNVTVMNTGDIGVQFQWPEKRFEPEFNIAPAGGFIAAHSEVVCEIVYHPMEVGRDGKRDNIELKISEGHPPLVLSVINTMSVSRPSQAEVIKFQCPVRTTASQSVTVKNESAEVWNLKPSIDNPAFTGADVLTIKPRESATYAITYAPTISTKNKPDQQSDSASLFFPLPTGGAMVYALEGVADVPSSSSPPLDREVIAKTMFTEKLSVKNWMKSAQRFNVTMKWSFDSSDESIVVKSVPTIDVPADSTKEYRFTFYSYKEVKVSGTVTFTNDSTQEFQYYQLNYVVKPPKEIAVVSLKTPARQSHTESISIINPLDRPVTLALKCDSNDVSVPPTLSVQGKSTGRVPLTYFPLIPTKDEVTARLVAQCQELGEFPYSLKLTATQPAMEKAVRVQCALGQMVSATLRLTHYSKTAVDFVCKFTDPKQVTFTKSNGQMTIKATPCADPKVGQEVSFDISFEPCRLGDSRETFEVTSATAGTYQFSLLGTCLPPQRQGPLDIKPGAAIQIPFKNVFVDTVAFTMVSDSPQFVVAKPSEAIPGKKSSSIGVSYKADDPNQVVRGKLSVQATNPVDGSPIAWTYYLRGVKSDGSK
eukprot:PhM_4_TR5537/c0_g1_i1/m.106423/K17570/HYDIN; hydrocephalus-inducing protein